MDRFIYFDIIYFDGFLENTTSYQLSVSAIGYRYWLSAACISCQLSVSADPQIGDWMVDGGYQYHVLSTTITRGNT